MKANESAAIWRRRALAAESRLARIAAIVDEWTDAQVDGSDGRAWPAMVAIEKVVSEK